MSFLFLMTFELVPFKMAAPIEPNFLISHKIACPDGLFFGVQSPLSNFNNSKFTVKGIQYDCNERFYVSGKAVCNGSYSSDSSNGCRNSTRDQKD